MAKEAPTLQTIKMDEDMRAAALLIVPDQDYMLVEYIEDKGGIVKSADIRDSKQKGRVLAVGPGSFDHGVFIKPDVKVGDIILWEEAGEANTPADMKNDNLFLVKYARKMATLLPKPVNTEKESK